MVLVKFSTVNRIWVFLTSQMYCQWVPVQICRILLFEHWYLRVPTLVELQI